MKVIFLNTQMEAAGAQKALLTLAAGLRSLGHTVTVVTMYDKGDYVSLFSRQYGLDIVDLKMKPSNNLLTNAMACMRGMGCLYKLMVVEKFDVLQTFTHYSNIVGPFVGSLARIPIRVSSQRNSLPDSPKWFRILDKIVANSNLVQVMTAVSKGTYQFCIEEGIRPDKLITIYNGIDAERYQVHLSFSEKREIRADLGLPKNAVLVTMVARLHPQKGHIYLLKVIPEIIAEFPEVHFVFVGEGELQEELVKEVHDLGLSTSTHFIGVRHDIPRILACSHLFVLPSLYEGMPNALLEAMAAGLPVVATNIDGNPELIVEGKTGLLVGPGQITELKQAILKILRAPMLAESMGNASKIRVQTCFSIKKNIDSYIQLYENLLGKEKETI